MDDFTSKPGVPNLYGLIQGPANAVGPGKRPLSAMTPTIVLKDGKLFLVLGSPGGARIITTVANILMGVVDYGMDIQEAVNAPRFHNQWMPDIVSVEQWFSPDATNLLQRMGHKIEIGETVAGDWEPYWSDGECIAIDSRPASAWAQATSETTESSRLLNTRQVYGSYQGTPSGVPQADSLTGAFRRCREYEANMKAHQC